MKYREVCELFNTAPNKTKLIIEVETLGLVTVISILTRTRTIVVKDFQDKTWFIKGKHYTRKYNYEQC